MGKTHFEVDFVKKSISKLKLVSTFFVVSELELKWKRGFKLGIEVLKSFQLVSVSVWKLKSGIETGIEV